MSQTEIQKYIVQMSKSKDMKSIQVEIVSLTFKLINLSF